MNLIVRQAASNMLKQNIYLKYEIQYDINLQTLKIKHQLARCQVSNMCKDVFLN